MSFGRIAGALALALGLWLAPALAQDDKGKAPRKPEPQDRQDKDKGPKRPEPREGDDKKKRGPEGKDCDCSCHHRAPGDSDGKKRPPPPPGDGDERRKPPPPPPDGDKEGRKAPPPPGWCDECCNRHPSDGDKGHGKDGGNPGDGGKGKQHGNNGVGNGEDPQPPGKAPVNDGPGTGKGDPGNKGKGRGK